MKKILLIEDNPEMRENIAEILELAGFMVTTAENGKEGVTLAKRHQPDLIICDIMMPVLDGYGVLHILGRNLETASIPFIFLTAKAEKSDMRKGMNLGADDYLIKPFEEMELLDAIETRLKRNEILKKEFSKNLDGLNKFMDEAGGMEELDSLSNDRKIKLLKKKETIFREGDYANYLYFIVKGKVKTTKMDNYGKDLVINMHHPGSFFGYMALLEDGERKETATVLEDTELAIIPKEDLLALIQKNRDVANKFIQMLAGNVQEKEERLLKLAYSPVRERTADTLLKLHEQEKEKGSSIQITREDLAGIVGTATESLIRTLSDFKDEGLIETEGRDIKIADEQGLMSVAGLA